MKKKIGSLQKISILFLGVLLVFSSLMLISSKTPIVPVKIKNAGTSSAVVIMELFTSQGCSSCSPADALLASYAAVSDQPIIALSFHVDYWNRLGWKDPFSSPAYSQRQQWYSRHLPRHSIYTPQLVVNGTTEAVGNNRTAVKQLVQEQLAGKQSRSILIDELAIEQNNLQFRYAIDQTDANSVLNIAMVQKQVTTVIKAGENEGVTLTNRNIVRSFATQAASAKGSVQIPIPKEFNTADYGLVVFIQDKNNGTIHGAVMKTLQ